MKIAAEIPPDDGGISQVQKHFILALYLK